MSAISVQINNAEVTARLAAIQLAINDLSPAMEIGARLWLNRITRGFRAGTDPWGKSWAPLKQRRGQPLRDTGRLRNSIVAESDPRGFSIGTNTCYAIVHQFGATVRADQPAGRRSLCGYTTKGAKMLRWRTRDGHWHSAKEVEIPRRAFFPITEAGNLDPPGDWIDELLATLQRHIEGAAQ